jgi:hypothetical protein
MRLAPPTTFLCIASALPTLADESPLRVVMDGREAAESSMLTEAGMRTLAQSAANVVLYGCGALAIFLVACALVELYRASDGDVAHHGAQASWSGAMWKLGIAALISVPALIAAILPHTVL